MSELSSGRKKLAAAADELHEAARQTVGFDDFGEPYYLEGLNILLEAYDRESRLNEFGRAFAEQLVLGVLQNRLSAQRMWKQHPHILQLEVRRPIFVLGLVRTGTTAFHHLLGQDPRMQTLEYWLAAYPRPRPPREQWESHPDYQRAARELELMYQLDPSLKAMHLMTADGPEECRHLLAQSFTDDVFDCNATIPTYSAWYDAYDGIATYLRHRDLLKLIGSTTPERRWLLKYPVHMGNLRALFRVYPDACVVQTHRDPCKVIPSICSLVAGWRSLYEDDVDRPALACWLLELWARRLERGLQVRREGDPKQFIDLHFREILADPVGAARKVYEHFGIEMTDEAERRLGAWKAENPRGKHGEHKYTAEEFGLSDETIADRFSAYMRHFGIERE